MLSNNIDELIYLALFSVDEKVKKHSRKILIKLSKSSGIYSASTYHLYKAAAKGRLKKFTVPAINMRTLTYDFARVIFRAAIEKKVGAFIFELSRMEMQFTNQTPDEFSLSIFAAALREGYKGHIFLVGDHFQINLINYKTDPKLEIKEIKKLIDKSIKAQIYNLDIDASTLVNLNETDLNKQQELNFLKTAELVAYIRKKQPKNIKIAIGGEIGHIGERNSTTDDMIAFMNGYQKQKSVKRLNGLSKVSVATGSFHGGKPMSNGKLEEPEIDLNVLKDITKLCRQKYGIGGTVQHGASTLPRELFSFFPKNNTLEIHLATSFSNIVYDNMPKKLKKEIYEWMSLNLIHEKKLNENSNQFIYSNRKKALGQFRKRIWDLDEKTKEAIRKDLKQEVLFIFEKLNVFNSKSEVIKHM